MPLTSGDLREMLYAFESKGGDINDLEGLLIHSDDLRDLFKEMSDFQNGVQNSPVRICGVKLIESQYAEKRSAFMIFKPDHEQYPSQSIWDIPMHSQQLSTATFSGSGVIPGLEHLVKTPLIIDDVKLIKKKKKLERKHSNARKIELG